VKQIELSAGTIEYADTGGDGPALVLLHGLMMDASLSDGPIACLSADHRCLAPTLPLGAHRHPMHPGADLSLPGIARLVAEFLDRLDLHDVTVVGNDTGGALVQLLMCDAAERVGRAVLASCDAFDNFPPGLTGKALLLTGKLPPAMFGLFMQQMRVRAVRRLPIAFGWLTIRGDAATARWMKPVLTQPQIRRDTVRALRAAAADTGLLLAAAECLPRFHHPALVIWASRDRVMPPEHGRRLAELLPQARLAQVEDSYTLIPLDQPARLAQLIREFTHASGTTQRSRPEQPGQRALPVTRAMTGCPQERRSPRSGAAREPIATARRQCRTAGVRAFTKPGPITLREARFAICRFLPAESGASGGCFRRAWGRAQIVPVLGVSGPASSLMGSWRKGGAGYGGGGLVPGRAG
jgi:pimeloyl-ACP methyl ester carboxylesterase